jgi:hypothetical protein
MQRCGQVLTLLEDVWTNSFLKRRSSSMFTWAGYVARSTAKQGPVDPDRPRHRVHSQCDGAARTTRKRNAQVRARQRRKTPCGRLTEDGASTNAAMRRRIQLIAHERRLQPSEVAKALTCRTFAVVQFAERHRISCDWLIFGDLKGLLRTAQARERPPVDEERRLIAQLLQKLDPRLLPAALQGIRQVVAEQS